MEIGSEFWISKQPENFTKKTIPSWIKKFGFPILTSSGRGAINLALKQFTPKVKIVLLPSYICESVIIPFEKAGYKIKYYDLNLHLEPEIGDIDLNEIGVFLHIGYFGFPTNKNLKNIIVKMKSESVIVIEDVTHTLFSNFFREVKNDYIVASIRKWFGIPSGGFLASPNIVDIKLKKAPNELIALRFNGLSKKYKYIKNGDKSLKEDILNKFNKAEELLNEDADSYQIDNASYEILSNIDNKMLRQRRNCNYRYLLNHLDSNKKIKVVFNEITDELSPIFFPIYVKDGRAHV